MSTIFFIRHGQASFGKDDYDQLSERGRLQSGILARYFDSINKRFDLVCRGTLRRHRETADELLFLLREKGQPQPEVIELPGLDEYDTRGIFTELIPEVVRQDPSLAEDVRELFASKRSFQRVFEAIMTMWTAGMHTSPGMMQWGEFAATVNDAVRSIMKDHGRGKTIAVFTSGGPISAVVQGVLGFSDINAVNVATQLINTSVSRFLCTNDRLMISTLNEYPHLEQENDADLITYR